MGKVQSRLVHDVPISLISVNVKSRLLIKICVRDLDCSLCLWVTGAPMVMFCTGDLVDCFCEFRYNGPAFSEIHTKGIIRNVVVTAVMGRKIQVINQTPCCKRLELLRRGESVNLLRSVTVSMAGPWRLPRGWTCRGALFGGYITLPRFLEIETHNIHHLNTKSQAVGRGQAKVRTAPPGRPVPR